MKTPLIILKDLRAQFKVYQPKTLPAYKKIYEILRQQILSGILLPGMRLPSSRTLAEFLSVARNTIISAINQLCYEGYTEAKEKSGIFILSTKPVLIKNPVIIKSEKQIKLSKRGQVLFTQTAMQTSRSGFAIGVPDLQQFPYVLWQRYIARYAKNPKMEWLTNSQQGGNFELRKTLAEYLRLVRGINCDPKQILITYGTQHSLQLIVDVLADPRDDVWMENPGYAGARAAFIAANLAIINQPIDNEGLAPSQQAWNKPPRLIYTTPSHQFPTGVLMSATRRRQLVTAASQYGACIIEDDYDSEFCYNSAPVAALQSLSPSSVIYLGTFNKLFFPTFHMGYVVIPEHLIETITAIQTRHIRAPSQIQQKALADFIKDGHLTAYIRKMRNIYQTRRNTLINILQSKLDKSFIISGTDAGLHIVLSLPKKIDDIKLARKLAENGLNINLLRQYCAENEMKINRGLVLGFGNIREHDIVRLTKQLVMIINKFL